MLLDTVTYRISGHSPSDASSYRSKEEIERWQQADSILAFERKLVEAGIHSAGSLAAARACTDSTVFDMFRLAVDLEASPRISIDSELVGSVMFSNRRAEKLDSREPEFLQDLADADVVAEGVPDLLHLDLGATHTAHRGDEQPPLPQPAAKPLSQVLPHRVANL